MSRSLGPKGCDGLVLVAHISRKLTVCAALLAAGCVLAGLGAGTAFAQTDLESVPVEPQISSKAALVQHSVEPAPRVRMIKAQASNPFSSLVGNRRKRRPKRVVGAVVERYVMASDDRVFLFEQSPEGARIQFLCAHNDQRLGCLLDENGPAPEIYQLLPTRGPRGDQIYKNAQGDTLLRIASYGGATVFWPGELQGLAASKSFGDDAILKLVPTEFETARRRAQAATAAVSAATGAPIIFDIGSPPRGFSSRAPEETPSPRSAVLADAVMRVAKGLKDVAKDSTGARIISGRIERVVFIRSDNQSVSLNGKVLEINYAPNLDVAGRPSSVAISRYLEETL